MWSGWSEHLELYLGQSVAMLARADHKPMVFEHPASMPLAQVLAQLSLALDKTQAAGKPKRRRVRVTLSAAYAPAVSFSVPAQLASTHELAGVALACASEVLHVEPAQLQCAVDVFNPHVAAAAPRLVFDELAPWVHTLGGRITSVQPSWALASQCKAARARGVSGLLLHEFDAVTLLTRTGAQTVQGVVNTDAARTMAQDWQARSGLHKDQLLKLAFSPENRCGAQGGPRTWRAHWFLI